MSVMRSKGCDLAHRHVRCSVGRFCQGFESLLCTCKDGCDTWRSVDHVTTLGFNEIVFILFSDLFYCAFSAAYVWICSVTSNVTMIVKVKPRHEGVWEE
jgi:hypothetical protein